MARRLVAVLLIISILVISSMTIINFSSSGAPERIFTVACHDPIDSANPFVGICDESYRLYGLIYDYLTVPNQSMDPSPNLATSWYYMDGPFANSTGSSFSGLIYPDPADWPIGSIWQYNLTQDAYWNDGVMFTADDVKWTIEIQIGANFNSYWAYQPYTRSITKVEKLNDYTVRIFFADFDTKQPLPAAFGSSLFIPIMPKHAFEGHPSTYMGQEWTGIPAIGTGPFMGTAYLESEIIAKEVVTLVRNPFYNFIDQYGIQRGLGAYYGRYTEIDRYVMKFFSEESTLTLALKTGGCDAGNIQASTYLMMRDDPTLPSTIDLQTFLSPDSYSKEVVINDYEEAAGDLNPLRLDPAVQRAMALATNKTYIKDIIYKGFAYPGYGLISPVSPNWYWEPDTSSSRFDVNNETGVSIYNYTKPQINVMDYDIVTANEILNAAGYIWQNSSGKTVRVAGNLAAQRMQTMFGYNPSSILGMELLFEHVVEQEVFEDRQVGDFLVSEWEKIGVWIQTPQGGHTISLVNRATWNYLIYHYTYNTMQTYWSGDIDPNYLTYVVSSYALWGWNEFGTVNSEYDQYYLNQLGTFDYSSRKYWVDRCSEWVYLSGSIITTVYPKSCWVWNELRWANQGNWSLLPGISMENIWPENPLLFNIEYQYPPNVPPVAIIVGDDSGLIGEEMNFTGLTSYDSDGYIASYVWTFDDTSLSLYSASITRKWNSSGTHWVRLTVTDNAGSTNSATLYVEILENITVDINPKCTIVGKCELPDDVDHSSLIGLFYSLESNATYRFNIQANGSFTIPDLDPGNYTLLILAIHNSTFVILFNDDVLLSPDDVSSVVNLGTLELASSEEEESNTISNIDANPVLAVASIIGILLSLFAALMAIFKIGSLSRQGGRNSK
ncbi:MAG: ABC transporter substrate-binding protein [Thermoplasmata archaeon]|nr:ABC transporter substrate-binding protein [Thermoplasmata archaeon]